jgi:vacuolar-type H+-ATPase catalytic subunit A/Vma1
MDKNIRFRDIKEAFKNLKASLFDQKMNKSINIDNYMYMYTRKYSDGYEYDIFKNIHTRHNEAVEILEKPDFQKAINLKALDNLSNNELKELSKLLEGVK